MNSIVKIVFVAWMNIGEFLFFRLSYLVISFQSTPEVERPRESGVHWGFIDVQRSDFIEKFALTTDGTHLGIWAHSKMALGVYQELI